MELETPEEVQKALEEKDISLSIDEINKVAELIRKQANGELSDEDFLTALAIYGAVKATVVAAAIVTHFSTRGRW